MHRCPKCDAKCKCGGDTSEADSPEWQAMHEGGEGCTHFLNDDCKKPDQEAA